MFLMSLPKQTQQPSGQMLPDIKLAALTRDDAALLFLALGLSACAVLAGSSLAPAQVAIAHGMGVSEDALWPRLLVSLPALGVPVGVLLYSRFAQPKMDRAVLLTALTLYAICGLAGALLAQPGLMLAARFAQGLTIAPLMLIALRILSSRPDARADMALQSTILTAVTVLVLLTSGVLGAIDWHLPFALNLAPLALVPFVQRLVPEGQPAAVMPTAPAPVEQRPEGHDDVILSSMVMAFLAMATFFAIPTQIPGALTRADAGGSGLAALVIIIGVLAASFSGMVLRRMREQLAPSRLLVLAWSAVLIGHFQLSFATGLPLVLSGTMLIGLGFGTIFPVLNHWAASAASNMVRPNLVGMVTAAFYIGQFAAPLLGVAALRAGAEQSVFLPYLVLTAFSLGFTLLESQRLDRAVQRPTASATVDMITMDGTEENSRSSIAQP